MRSHHYRIPTPTKYKGPIIGKQQYYTDGTPIKDGDTVVYEGRKHTVQAMAGCYYFVNPERTIKQIIGIEPVVGLERNK